VNKIIMPSGGQTAEESLITKWHKTVGDRISRGDILFEIETDKATLEVESWCEGYLRAIVFGEHESAAAGQTVAYIGPADEPLGDRPVIQEIVHKGKGKPASPLAKKLAKERGIDLSNISAGPVIKKQDVLDYSPKIPLATVVSHYYTVTISVDMTGCAAFCDKISYDGILVKCVSVALKKHPSIAKVTGGTISILNLGEFGVSLCTAAIAPPETCVLAVGSLAERAVSVNRQIVSRDMTDITATFDHRAIDGPTGAMFMRDVKRLLENPELIFII